MGQTLEQKRANHAWEKVCAFSSAKEAEEYAQEAKKMPMRIMSAGLGHALAFILAKAKDKKPKLKQLHDDLTEWVIKERPIHATHSDSLMESIISGDSDFLRRVTDEALAYLVWLNRFIEAKGLADDAEK